MIDSPLGPLTAVAEDGAITGLYLDRQRHRPDDGSFGRPDDSDLAALAEQLDAYFAGDRTDFDLPVRAAGTRWQQLVWGCLCEIPYGQTMTYAEVAAAIGRPGAARAVGAANGRNPVSIVVPCHRVVAAGGSLGGYGGGLERKLWLLEHERRHAATPETGIPRTGDARWAAQPGSAALAP